MIKSGIGKSHEPGTSAVRALEMILNGEQDSIIHVSDP